MAFETDSALPLTSVELKKDGEEWLVRIVEKGHERVYSFDVESYAEVYAEGQRIRLGLNEFEGA